MLKERREAAQQLANHLMAVEVALDKAVTEATALLGYMPQARIQANLAAEVGHEAIECGAAAIASLVQARTQIIATHRALAETRTRVGLDAVALGGLMRKNMLELENTPLAAVRTAA